MKNNTKRIRIHKRVNEKISTTNRANGQPWLIPNTELKKRLLYQRGNKKIGSDTLIYSIDTATDCIANNIGCCAVCSECYAKKSEQQYTTSYIFKLNQRRQFLLLDVWELIRLFCQVIEGAKKPIRFIRWNEGGELRNIDDLKKISAISDYLGVKYSIQSYIYTCRRDIIEQLPKFRISKSLTINTSYENDEGYNSFVAVNRAEMQDIIDAGKLVCSGDCRMCNLCKYEHGRVIFCRKH